MLSWLKNVFGRPAPASTEAAAFVPETDDQFHLANADILDGVQFSVTLQVRTPLAILQHHGEIFRGLPSRAPVYGTGADGIWIPHLIDEDTYDVLRQGQTHASDVGSVEAGRYLPFLKAFRRIVESGLPHEEQLQLLSSIPTASADFRKFWNQLEINYPDFPHSFFYMALTELPGVGRVTAKRLYEAGFVTPSQVLAASDAELAAIPKIGLSLIGKMRGG